MTRFRIVAFAPNRWHGPWMNRQQILSRLARDYSVVYSNGQWFAWQRHSERWRQGSWTGCFEQTDGVWLDTPPRYMMRWPRVPIVDRMALAGQGRRIRRFVLSKGDGPIISYVFHPRLLKEARAIRADFTVYHAYDLFQDTPVWGDISSEYEKELLEEADMVLASSDGIAQGMQARVAREIIVLHNAADSEYFLRQGSGRVADPPDIASIPRPRIGYTGNLNRKVDFVLVKALAERRPDWQFVFVGPLGSLDEETASPYQACQAMPNVHFLGQKIHTELPVYMASMDVNTMWYRTQNAKWMLASYPLKLHEYLAVGRPVISTEIPAVRQFSSVVAFADSADDWERAIQSALAGEGVGTVAERRQVALANSWDARVARLRSLLESNLLHRDSA